MALSKSTITGRVPLPTDENMQFAELTFALSGLDTEGASVLPGGVSTRAVLVGSDIPAGFELWQNTAGLRGTHYRVLARWTVKDRDGVRDQYADIGIIQIGSDASYTLADLLNSSVPQAVGTFWSALTQAQYDAAIQAAIDAAASAVEAEVLVNSIKSPSLFAARNVADLLAPVAVPTGLLDTVVLKKLRTDYDECAVYHNFDAGGEWLRQLFTKRFNTGTLGLPRHTLGTVANLYASAAISKPAANNVSETRGTAATVTQASSAATRVGTWSTPATVLTTTDVTWSATIGDTATFSITGVDRIDLRALMAANGGIGKVTIKESGVEIDEANYLLPAGHLVNFLNSATPTTTAHIPLAGGLDTAKTYSVEIKVDVSNPGANRVYVAGLLGFAALAFNAVGVHGTVFDATLGSVNSAMMLHSGTTIVYEVTGATKIDMRQVVSTVSGIASYKVFDNAGALVESGTHDQYSNSGTVQTSLTVMPDETKGTFYLHVTSGKTKNAGSTGYRTYATGATRFDKTTAGVAGTDIFDDNGVQSNISNPNTGTDWALIGNGNLEQATQITKPGELAATKAYVGGSHAFETVNSIAYAVDGVTVDYAGAAAGAQFVGAREVRINTNSTLLFPSDSSAFATVTHAMKITKLGYSTDTTITTLADAVAFDDFIGMLICPNTQMSGGTWGASQGGMTGGGFELVAWDQNHLINSYDDGGTIIADPARSMAFVNAEYLVICTINTVTIPDLFKTTPFRAADQFGLVQDRIDNMIKSYFRTFVTDANGALIPAGTTWGYSKHYRTFKGDFRAVLGA